RAAAHAGKTPLDEVLAVVGKKAISVFTEPRARAAQRGGAGVRRGEVRMNLHRPAGGELREGHFLDRAAAQPGLEAGVVDDAAVAGVEPVVHEAPAGCREVRSEGQAVCHDPSPKSGDVGRIVGYSGNGAISRRARRRFTGRGPVSKETRA